METENLQLNKILQDLKNRNSEIQKPFAERVVKEVRGFK